MDHAELTAAVNGLIETAKDGEYGFRRSAEQARRLGLQLQFTQRAESWQRAAAELRELVVKQLSGKPEESGSVMRALHRGWVAVKSTMSGYADDDLLRECERSEQDALARYREVLAEDLPPVVRSLISRQYDDIKRHQAHMRTLLNAEQAVRQ
jgi:uncharacterized protein (TIGR02284 family)